MGTAASRLVNGLRQGLLELRYLGTDPAAVVRHRRRSTVVAGPGFLGYRGGVFNPGAVATEGGGVLLLCKAQVRHWLDAAGPHHQDFLVGPPVLIRLDQDLRMIDAQLVSLEGFDPDAMDAIEDFRLFRVGAEIWVNHHVIRAVRSPERVGYSSARVALARLDPGSATLKRVGSPRVDCTLQALEKNWLFVEQDGDLILHYGVRPYRVLRSTSRTCCEFATVVAVDPGPALGDVGGFGTLTSLSTNPVVYDGAHFLVFIHQVDPTGLGRLYYQWAMLIDRSTLLPVRIGRTPLLGGIGARGRRRGVLYAMAVVIRGDDVVVFHGEGDSHISYTRFRRNLLDRNWVGLQPPVALAEIA